MKNTAEKILVALAAIPVYLFIRLVDLFDRGPNI